MVRIMASRRRGPTSTWPVRWSLACEALRKAERLYPLLFAHRTLVKP
jgi:hypothetical protein